MNEKYSEKTLKIINQSYLSIDDGGSCVEILPVDKYCTREIEQNYLIFNIDQTYKLDNKKDSESEEKELIFINTQPREYLISISEFILNGEVINLSNEQRRQIKSQERVSLGQVTNKSDIRIHLILKTPLKPLFLAVDLECQVSPYKMGSTIFDISIVSFDNNFIFESNKCVNNTVRKPLEFEDYIPILLTTLYDYCERTPHNQIFFIAHNGFDHDFSILFDNLVRFGYFGIFDDIFHESIFLDSLPFFRQLNLQFPKPCKGKYPNSLENLYYQFGSNRYTHHVSKYDCKILIELMCLKYNSQLDFISILVQFDEFRKDIRNMFAHFMSIRKKEFLDVNQRIGGFKSGKIVLNYDRKNFTLQIFNDYFVVEPRYQGILYSQLHAAFADDNFEVDLKPLIHNNFCWFSLVELGKQPENELYRILGFLNPSDKVKVINWCKKMAELPEK